MSGLNLVTRGLEEIDFFNNLNPDIAGGLWGKARPAKRQIIIIINNKFNFSFTLISSSLSFTLIFLMFFIIMLLHDSSINSSGNNIFSHTTFGLWSRFRCSNEGKIHT